MGGPKGTGKNSAASSGNGRMRARMALSERANDLLGWEQGEELFGWAVESPENERIANAVLDSFTSLPGGLDAKVEYLAVADGRVSVMAELHKRGDPVGSMMRTFHPSGYVEHDAFMLDSAQSGKGYGRKVFAHQIAAYRKAGITEITTHAAGGSGYNGGYTWARFGFQPNQRGKADQLRSEFIRHAGRSGASTREQARLAKHLKGKPLSAIANTRLTGSDGKTVRAGRDFLSNKSYNATFSLKKGSESLKTFKAYQREKGD